MAIRSIQVNYDRETGEYYALWEIKAIGAGKTRREALEDLKSAARLGVDRLIDIKRKEIRREK